jgi:GTP-binding protein HflX
VRPRRGADDPTGLTIDQSQALAPAGAARAVLVGVDLPGAVSPFDDTLDELALLAQSAGDEPVARIVTRRKSPDAALFVGAGKAGEIKALVDLHQAQGVIFDQPLSPVQQRNLERMLGVPVADRTALILDIFADRAQSHEGKLQVELARLQYLSTLKTRLEKVKRQHQTRRRSRERSGTFRISLVGYTNAGKSTLFNGLVKARAYAADQLFATLDTTTRALWLQDIERTVSLSDTVGFIRDLPHKLVQAFQATLTEAADADLLLHVVDASSPLAAEQMADVERVLSEIGAGHIMQILVFNKIDLLAPSQRPRVAVDAIERPDGERAARVFVSAASGEGLDVLRRCIADAVRSTNRATPAGEEASGAAEVTMHAESDGQAWPPTGT